MRGSIRGEWCSSCAATSRTNVNGESRSRARQSRFAPVRSVAVARRAPQVRRPMFDRVQRDQTMQDGGDTGRSPSVLVALLFTTHVGTADATRQATAGRGVEGRRQGGRRAADQGGECQQRQRARCDAALVRGGSGQRRLVELLLANGADPNAKDLEYGKSSLRVAAVPWSDIKAPEARTQIVAMMIDKGAGIDGRRAVRHDSAGHLSAASAIVTKGGADAAYLNQALAAAKRANAGELTTLLMKAGAKEPGPLDAHGRRSVSSSSPVFIAASPARNSGSKTASMRTSCCWFVPGKTVCFSQPIWVCCDRSI